MGPSSQAIDSSGQDKAQDIVGLYLRPPDHAAVLSLGEKTRSGHWSKRNPCCRWDWTMGTALPACFTMRLEPSWETQRENAAFTETIIARQTHLLGRFTVAVAWSPSMWEPNPPARTLGGWPGGFPPVVHPLAKLAHKLVDQQPRHSHDDRCRHPLTESRGRAGIGLGASRLSRTLAPRRGGC